MRWRRIVSPRGSARRLPIVGASLLFGVAAAAAAPPAAPSAAGAVVARVNGKPILRRDFDMAVQLAFRQRGIGQRRHGDLEATRSAVLENLIDNELLYQKATTTTVTVPEAEVRQEVDRLKAALGAPEDVAAFLKQNGVTERDFTDQVRRTQVVRHFVDKTLGVPAAPGDADARAFYDAHPDQFIRQEAVHISQIVVQVAPDASPAARAQARSKAEAILAELRGGKDFAELARLHSDGAEGKKGGDSGWVWPGGGALPAVERAALALKIGQSSDIIETRRGFHIIKATERRPAGTIPFDEARGPIIDKLTAERRLDKVRSYVADLRKSARIEKTL